MLRARSLAIAASILVFASVFAGPEDLDGNGKIDLDDLTLLVDSWKKAKHGQPGWERADLNGDGRLDHADVAIFLDAFLRQYVPTATLADYMPLQTADVRLWQGEQGLVEAIETVASAGTPGVVEDKLVGMFNQELSRILWRVRNGRAVSLVGVRGGDTGFLFSPPDGVALPDSLQQGSAVTLPFEVQQENGGASGSGSLTLKLESMAESVDTPAGAFTNCLRLRVQLRFSVGSQQFSHDSVWWLAKNVGLVKRNVELYGSSTALSLAYAKVGSTVLGQRPTVNVAQDWPAPKDSLFIAEAGTALGGMRALANRSLGGVTVVPLANLELPLGTEADYWVVEGNNNYIRGRAGYRSGDQADDVFSPAFTWPGQVQLGQVVAGEGQVLHNGSPAGTYYASFAVVGVNQTVTVPAGTFTGCNVWCIGLGKKGPSGSLDEWGGMRVWMKPGVGPVQAEEWQGDAARPRETVLHTVFLRIGTGTSYGTQPTADYMALRKFDQYPCRRLETPEGRWRVYSVVGQTTVDGNRVWRETGAASWGQPPNDLLDEIWSDFYGTSGNSLIVPGYEPNPEEDLPLVTLVFRPTPRFPNPLPMGDPASVQCNIYRSDNNQLIGRLTATIMYCSNEDV
ncbi:MAG: hypothetical protein H5T86_12330, partial [Armatimonadetes bacterium]|nr:hypothetical protein [Armatimonadota bacterium]